MLTRFTEVGGEEYERFKNAVLDFASEATRRCTTIDDVIELLAVLGLHITKDTQEGRNMCEKKHVSQEQWDKAYTRLKKTLPTKPALEAVLDALDLAPPEKSPFPEITPGEWEVSNREGVLRVWRKENVIRRICTVYEGSGNAAGCREGRCNAELIAAAPDLRDAAYDVWVNTDVTGARGRKLEAALLKAGVKL